MKKIKGVVFDFDGTLAELQINFELMKRKIASVAACFMPSRPEPDHVPALEWLDMLAREIERNDPALALEFHCRGRLIITAMELDAARVSSLFPYTRPVLDSLARKGVATAIITRNSHCAVKTVFPDVEKRCGVFISREDAPSVKPDPAHALAALKKIGINPEESIVIGDHLLDIDTARNAEIRCGVVATGSLSLEELSVGEPDFMASDLLGLMRELEEKNLLQPAAR